METKVIAKKQSNTNRYVLLKQNKIYSILKSDRTYFGWTRFEPLYKSEDIKEIKIKFESL